MWYSVTWRTRGPEGNFWAKWSKNLFLWYNDTSGNTVWHGRLGSWVWFWAKLSENVFCWYNNTGGDIIWCGEPKFPRVIFLKNWMKICFSDTVIDVVIQCDVVRSGSRGWFLDKIEEECILVIQWYVSWRVRGPKSDFWTKLSECILVIQYYNDTSSDIVWCGRPKCFRVIFLGKMK